MPAIEEKLTCPNCSNCFPGSFKDVSSRSENEKLVELRACLKCGIVFYPIKKLGGSL